MILVYGAAGPTLFTDTTSDHRRYPELLGSRGYVVSMPTYANGAGALPSLEAAVGALAARDDVDPKRIGAIGFSRGAHLALELGAADARIGAVVELYGWLDDTERDAVTRMPPVLILHGEKDRNVRVAEAHALEKLFRAKGIDFEMHLYPDEGHGFDPPALEDSAQRAVAFFDSRLGHD